VSEPQRLSRRQIDVRAKGLKFNSGSSPKHRVFTEPTPGDCRKVAPFAPNIGGRFFGACISFVFPEIINLKTMHMTRAATIVAWVENQPTANLLMIVYWCSIAITIMCEIASITILATISRNTLQDESESWMAVWFFAVDGGIAWIVARQCLDFSSSGRDPIAASCAQAKQ
jgi:hypothetical protein